jgi:hypothetical protein
MKTIYEKIVSDPAQRWRQEKVESLVAPATLIRRHMILLAGNEMFVFSLCVFRQEQGKTKRRNHTPCLLSGS